MTESNITKAAETRPGRAACAGPRKGDRPRADPRDCLIRAQCRWRAQGGDAACAACSDVVTQEKAIAGGVTTRSVV